MSRKILLVHEFYDVLGGGELLSLRLGEACKLCGYHVDLLTSVIEPDMVVKLFNIDPRRIFDKIIIVHGWMNRVLGKISGGRMVRFRRLLAYKEFFEKIINRYRDEYGLVIETQSNIIAPVDISYIHYPAIHDYIVSRRGLKWKMYNWIVSLIAHKMMTYRHGIVLTNSSWTARKIMQVYGVYALVVYPPVNVEEYEKIREVPLSEKERRIITVTRYTPEKNLGSILSLAKYMRDWEFVIVGSVGDPLAESVYMSLLRKKKAYGLSNVHLYKNLSRKKLLELLSSAKYYLHPPFPEHFGISVVEAISAGLIPIVYVDGGAWHDIVLRISPVLGYRTIFEVETIIKYLEDHRNKEYVEEIRKRGIMLSQEFTINKFNKRICKILKLMNS